MTDNKFTPLGGMNPQFNQPQQPQMGAPYQQQPQTSYAPQINLEEGLKPRIVVIGVGGAGSNAINNMILSDLQGVEFIVANTDAQAIEQSKAQAKVQLGLQATHGLGAGSHPEVGRAAAEESMHDVLSKIGGCHMLFVTAGMGGGTGTGAAPVIAKAAREHGILTIGVVTKPFHFEGAKRMRTADAGIEELQKNVDTLIVIPNQNLFRVANEKTTFADAFKMADEVLYSGVRSVTDLMMKPGLINLDFADVKTVMGEMMGKAMMGTGEAEGPGRAIEAAEAAISSPLLDDVSMKGAKAVLINVTGGMDMTLFEVDEAANRIREEVDPNAHIIFGSTFDESVQGKLRVSCVATGIDAHAVMAASLSQGMGSSSTLGKSQTTTDKTPSFLDRADQSTQADLDDFSPAPKQETSSFSGGQDEEDWAKSSQTSESDHYGEQSSAAETVDLRQADEIRPSTAEYQEDRKPSSTYDIYSSLRQDMAAKSSQPQSEGDDEHRGFFSRLLGRKKSALPDRMLSMPQRTSGALGGGGAQQPSQTSSPSTSQEDDLDVPAFLRRKNR